MKSIGMMKVSTAIHLLSTILIWILHFIFSVVHVNENRKRTKDGLKDMQQMKKRKTRRKTNVLTEKSTTTTSATSLNVAKKTRKNSECVVHADKDVRTKGEKPSDGQTQAHPGVCVPATEHAASSISAPVQAERDPKEDVTGEQDNSNSTLTSKQSLMLFSGPAEGDEEIVRGSRALTPYLPPSDTYERVPTSIEHTSPRLRSHRTIPTPSVSGPALRTEPSTIRTPTASGSKSSSLGKEQESTANTTLYSCPKLFCGKIFTTKKHLEKHWKLLPQKKGCKGMEKIGERPFDPKLHLRNWEEEGSSEESVPSPPRKKQKLLNSNTVKNSVGERPLGTQHLNVRPEATNLETPSAQSAFKNRANPESSTKDKEGSVSIIRKRGTPRRSTLRQQAITISP